MGLPTARRIVEEHDGDMVTVTMIAYFTAGAAVSLGYALVLWMSAHAIVRQRSIAPLVTGVVLRLGLLIVGIEDDSPAKEGGLLVGDILVGFEGVIIAYHDELLSHLTGEVVGNAAEVEVIRGGQRTTVQVTVAERQEPVFEEHGHHPRRHMAREMRKMRAARGRHR